MLLVDVPLQGVLLRLCSVCTVIHRGVLQRGFESWLHALISQGVFLLRTPTFRHFHYIKHSLLPQEETSEASLYPHSPLAYHTRAQHITSTHHPAALASLPLLDVIQPLSFFGIPWNSSQFTDFSGSLVPFFFESPKLRIPRISAYFPRNPGVL